MPLYLNELAPWENKREYYEAIQLGKDTRTQTKLISESTKALIGTQIASTNAIISSQERIREGVDNLSYGIDKVEQGIAGLQAAFEWGISEVVWQIEQNREVLKNILEILSAPLDTQGKELRKRAEEAYANGWYEDSLEDFLESEKRNRYDYSIHISIGMIYLFQKINKEKALLSFDKAIKYAKPKSNYHTSFALLYKGLIKRDLGLIEEAESCTAEAVQLSPDFTEAMYQNAQYNALLNKPSKSIQMLREAIELDVNYCEKVSQEKDFDKIEPDITNLFIQLRDKEASEVKKGFELVSERMDKFEILLTNINNNEPVKSDDKDIKKCMNRIEDLIQRDSYRDYLEAKRLINGFNSLFEKMHSNLKTQLDKIVSSYNSDIYNVKSSNRNEIVKINGIGYIWLGIPVSMILGIRGCFSGIETSEKSPGPSQLSEVFGHFFSYTFYGTLLTIVAYYVISGIIQSIGQKEPIGVHDIENRRDRVKEYINDLNII